MPSAELQQPPRETESTPEIYERPISIEAHETPSLEIAMTTIGKREPNEDAVLFDNQEQLAVVFDGVGGAAAGDLASRLARDNFSFAYQRMMADTEKMPLCIINMR